MTEWAAKKFWSAVEVMPVDGGFGVLLDQRRVMTPGRQPLVVPTRTLATRVAEEWDAVEAAIDPTHMPWTRSANSAIEKVAPQMTSVAAHLAEYAETDLLSYRAERPEELVLRQSETWDPLLDWAEERHSGRLAVTKGVMPVEQDADAVAALVSAAETLDAFEMTAFHDLVTLGGSYVVALRVLDAPADAEEMWRATRIDHDWQAEQWGRDDEAETQADAKRQAFLHAASFLSATREK